MAEQNSYDFWTRYSNLCLKCKVCPLKSVIKHMRGTVLTCPVERIRNEHWQFLLSALSIDNSLTEVCFKSTLPCVDDQIELWKKRRRRSNESYPMPYGYSPHNISDICKYTSRLLTVSKALQVLTIDNLPITKEDAEHLAEGIRASHIAEFAFKCYPYSNDVIETICRGLWDSKVSLLDFSSTDLSIVGLKFICNVIKKHRTRRSTEAFPDTLRHRQPVFEEMLGLTRITLNGNNIGDKGVDIICDSLADERWIKALDLQCCGITNDGAMCILKEITRNNVIQIVDLRLNDIDEDILEKISMQLFKNNDGKSEYSRLPLWRPRLFMKAIACRKVKLKNKALKRYSRGNFTRKEPKSLEHAFRISCEIFDGKDASTEDAAVQTGVSSEILNLQDRVRRLELRLLKEMSMRDSLMDLMEKFKLENANLRKEVMKLSTFEDVILIDQETYAEIKHVFEKFQRFLRLMKDHGLWGLVSTIGVAEYENTKLKAVPSDSKVCMVEKEQHSTENGPLRSPQNRFCSCQNPECVSNQKEIHGQVPQNQDKSHLKNSWENAKCTKVLRGVRDSYHSCDFVKNQLPAMPPLARKLSAGEIQTKSASASKPSTFKSPTSTDISKFKQLKTRQDLYEAVKSEMERIECVCHLNKVPQSPEKDSTPKNQSNVNNKGFLKSVSSQTAMIDSLLNYKAQKSNPPTSSASAVSQKSVPNSGSSSSTIKSFHSEGYPSNTLQQAVKVKSREWDEHVKKNFPEYSDEPGNSPPKAKMAKPDTTLNRTIGDPDYFKKRGSNFKKRLPSGTEFAFDYSKVNLDGIILEGLNSISNKTDKSSSKGGDSVKKEVNSVNTFSSDKFVESGASEKEIKSKKNQASNNKNNSNKSYLESVSDASTDKDVKSFSESEVYDSANKSDTTSSKNSKPSKISKSESGGGGSCKANASLVDNSSKSSKKNQKQKRLNQNSTSGGKFQKENASSSSVPSLSDITTVSSNSLNTDSVMDQLSESKKGLS